MRGYFWVRLGIVLGVPLLFFLAATESALLAYPLVVAMLLLLVGFALFGYRLLVLTSACKCKKTIIQILSFSFFCYVLFGWTAARNHVDTAFLPARIAVLEGTLVEDSLLSRSAKQAVRLRLASCTTGDGAKGSAKGVVSALVNADTTLVSGSVITMEGEFSPDGSLFLADTVQLLSISRLRAFRRKVLSLVERRFTLLIDDEQSRALALMLLLGRTGDGAFPLKDLSLGSGCAHLLALSGMHLQFFMLLLSFALVPLLGKRRGRVVSVAIALLYVLLVGPRPSLVRAMGMAILSLYFRGSMASYYSYLATACIQIVVFPSALSSMGSLFSYASYGGLLCNRVFSFYRPRWMESFFSSLYAILFTAIPTLAVWGAWQIGALFIAPCASLLMFALMGSSLLAFVFGKHFSFLVVLLHRLITAVFSFGSTLFAGGLDGGGFVLYLMVVLTLLASIGYAERALQKRRRCSYELEVRVRFTEGNKEPAR